MGLNGSPAISLSYAVLGVSKFVGIINGFEEMKKTFVDKVKPIQQRDVAIATRNLK